ncbi:hypothetical protein [Burkholderia sp. MSMB1498]|uniref:hypothetical protein n=1 Tax=Burkholderia sp. MSMB1498 TaxID=1637842 RepID=UPI0007532592|nr:hypothetical protein [Burkholderia sp. MSMB1498]KVK77827.1 hypothetical protein WS91_15305 [Burkholderia sp. MSMB1498]
MNTTDKIRTDALTDAQILSIAEPHFSIEESRYGKELNPHPQYHGSDLSVVLFARNLLAASHAEQPGANVTGEDDALRAAALFLTDDHKRDSLRSMLVDGKPMTRADLAQRLLAMIEFARCVPEPQSAASQVNDASVAAIQYALEAEEGLEWLSLWNEGEFDRCRRDWPDAPEDCYIGADPMHPETQRRLAAQAAEVDVRVERRRQVAEKGWTVDHDDGHVCGEIAALAAYYAMPAGVRDWPAADTGYGATFGQAILPDGWSAKIGDDRRRELVKAGALILAEIERLDRAAALAGGSR